MTLDELTHTFERQRPWLLRIARRHAWAAEAADVVQDVWLKAARHLVSLRAQTLDHWLARVTRHEALSLRRGHAARVARHALLGAPLAVEVSPRLEASQVLASLAPLDAEVVVCRDVLGLSGHETAARLGMTELAVRLRRFRAHRRARLSETERGDHQASPPARGHPSDATPG
jgi:DNA-directed RNA polymerase specialized sigma24 family protein